MSMEKEDREVRARMQDFGRYVEKGTPYGWGYVVLCFPFGSGGRMNYVSNAERPDVVRAMYEFISATKEGPWASDLAEMEAGTVAGDELIGRLRQEVASLEGELAIYRKRYG